MAATSAIAAFLTFRYLGSPEYKLWKLMSLNMLSFAELTISVVIPVHNRDGHALCSIALGEFVLVYASNLTKETLGAVLMEHHPVVIIDRFGWSDRCI